MSKWNVYGSVKIGLTMTIDADSEEEAIEKASEEFEGLQNLVGNGGTNKIVGTDDENTSLEADGWEPEFDSATSADGEEDEEDEE